MDPQQEQPDQPDLRQPPGEREIYLQRQYDVYTAAKATVARHHLRDVRRLALSGQYSFHEVRRARREYRQAKAVAPTSWRWGPADEDLETPKAA